MDVTKQQMTDLLAELGNDGAVAAELGVTRRTILRWRQKLGVPAAKPLRVVTDEDELKLVKLYDGGMNGIELAEMFSLPRARVIRTLRAHDRTIRQGHAGHAPGCGCTPPVRSDR